ncbi:MAG TPA: VOC family protein [Opitutaceae bacterium]|nr:VOC family protein [Opitutaceae bacterium]
MKINEIAFVAYPVSDVARARAFYEGLLGLKPSVLQVKDNQNAFIEYWIGTGDGHCLVVGAGAPMFQPGKTGATAALEVEDFDAALKELEAHGVKTLMPRYDGAVCSMILVEDPDGNQLMLHRRKSSSGS